MPGDAHRESSLQPVPSAMDVDEFEERFFREVESWFSAEIGCCDQCYDDFLRMWPAVYWHENAAFQESGIDVETLYDGSRLHEWYTLDEFRKLVEHVHCPECGAPLTVNIWPYELPFEPPGGFWEDSDAIAAIVAATPLLVLEHPYARRVLDVIKDEALRAKPVAVTGTLFRGRGELTRAVPAEFEMPPASVVREGRYNHAGKPALYLASTSRTCLEELRQKNGPALIAEIRLIREMRILDLTAAIERDDDNGRTLAALVVSSLLSAPSDTSGWSKPEYAFSRFVGDCAVAAGFDAIRYPSTRIGSGSNLVVLRPKLFAEVGIVERIVRHEGAGETVVWP